MLRLSVLILPPLITAALVYWLGAMALLGCFALVFATFLLSTAGAKSRAVSTDADEPRHRALHRRGAHMARS